MFNQQQQDASQSLYHQERLNEANHQRLLDLATSGQVTQPTTHKMLVQLGAGLVKLGNRLQSEREIPALPTVLNKSASHI